MLRSLAAAAAGPGRFPTAILAAVWSSCTRGSVFRRPEVITPLSLSAVFDLVFLLSFFPLCLRASFYEGVVTERAGPLSRAKENGDSRRSLAVDGG